MTRRGQGAFRETVMKLIEPSDTRISKSDIFREQALQAWRGQDSETRVLLDLSPRWLNWALAGILLLAGAGVLLAASTAIPKRVTSVALARLSSGGDSVLTEALFPLPVAAGINPGQTISFRSSDAGAKPIDLVILSILPDPERRQDRGDGASRRPARRLVVHGGIPVSRVTGDIEWITASGSSGTVQILIGQETVLHLLRPRPPGRSKA